MKPAPFDYVRPSTVEEALRLLAEGQGEAKVLAGGQSLVPLLSLRLARFEQLIDVNRLDELAGIRREGDAVVIGAMTRQAAIAASPDVRAALPVLAEATRQIGHVQIRSRGTIGGSLAHADPAAEYPAAALVADAEFVVANTAGTRTVPADDFFTEAWTTALEPEDLLLAVRFPLWGERSGFAVKEVARRHGDFALAGIAAGVRLEPDGRVARARVGALGLAARPLRLPTAERAVTGARVADIDLEAVGREAAATLDPPDDAHATGRFRARLAAVLVAQALSTAAQRAGGEVPV